ncbi:MAG: hypothetical protein IAG13_16260 [Deltaproteobacteria bacterium]|nr:hypothetical protein [Nannocystaceae bacterium]
MTRLYTFAMLYVALASCKIADPDHCLFKGEHVWCSANQTALPFCSPCVAAQQANGCVADPPTEQACPDFDAPETTTSSGGASESASESSSGISTDDSSSE